MDRTSFSTYLWFVIIGIVLATMILFATPFANNITQNVQNAVEPDVSKIGPGLERMDGIEIDLGEFSGLETPPV